MKENKKEEKNRPTDGREVEPAGQTPAHIHSPAQEDFTRPEKVSLMQKRRICGSYRVDYCSGRKRRVKVHLSLLRMRRLSAILPFGNIISLVVIIISSGECQDSLLYQSGVAG